jgi:hypothetical protein
MASGVRGTIESPLKTPWQYNSIREQGKTFTQSLKERLSICGCALPPDIDSDHLASVLKFLKDNRHGAAISDLHKGRLTEEVCQNVELAVNAWTGLAAWREARLSPTSRRKEAREFESAAEFESTGDHTRDIANLFADPEHQQPNQRENPDQHEQRNDSDQQMIDIQSRNDPVDKMPAHAKAQAEKGQHRAKVSASDRLRFKYVSVVI